MRSSGAPIHNVSTVYHKTLTRQAVWHPAGPTESLCNARNRERRANEAQNEGKAEETRGQSRSHIKYTLSSARVQVALSQFRSQKSDFDCGNLGIDGLIDTCSLHNNEVWP